MKILVTAGATRESLDAVRFLSNVSTGATGAALAESLRAHGHDVALLRGSGALAPAGLADAEIFSSAADLGERLRRRLLGGGFDAVVMAAAVADYRPTTTLPGKIGSTANEITVRLVRTPKILPQLKSFSPRPLTVIGFKLTVGADEASRRRAVTAQFAAGGVDAVVHNDLEEMRAAPAHPFRLYRTAEAPPESCAGAAALAAKLEALIAGGA
jgi:phosphopantothenate---cysteine ligase (CTP)